MRIISLFIVAVFFLTSCGKKNTVLQRLAIRRMRINTYIFVPRCCRNLIAHMLRTYNIAYVL